MIPFSQPRLIRGPEDAMPAARLGRIDKRSVVFDTVLGVVRSGAGLLAMFCNKMER